MLRHSYKYPTKNTAPKVWLFLNAPQINFKWRLLSRNNPIIADNYKNLTSHIQVWVIQKLVAFKRNFETEIAKRLYCNKTGEMTSNALFIVALSRGIYFHYKIIVISEVVCFALYSKKTGAVLFDKRNGITFYSTQPELMNYLIR